MLVNCGDAARQAQIASSLLVQPRETPGQLRRCMPSGPAPDVCSNCRVDGGSRFRMYECELCPARAPCARSAARCAARKLRAQICPTCVDAADVAALEEPRGAGAA